MSVSDSGWLLSVLPRSICFHNDASKRQIFLIRDREPPAVVSLFRFCLHSMLTLLRHVDDDIRLVVIEKDID